MFLKKQTTSLSDRLPKCFEKPPGSVLPVRAEAKVRWSALLTSDTLMLCYVSKKQQTSVGT